MGGAIIYVRNDHSPTTKTLISHSNGEVELISIKINKYNLVILNCYRPPQCTLEKFDEVINKVNKLLENLPTPMPNIMLCGDFNLPTIQWPEGRLSGGTLAHREQARRLMATADQAFLTQLVTRPTRKENILDLLFTNNQEAVRNYTVEETIISDHRLLTFSTDYLRDATPQARSSPTHSQPLAALNFYSNKVNWEHIRLALSEVDWDATLVSGPQPYAPGTP